MSTEKTQEQRIEDAAAALKSAPTTENMYDWKVVARIALEAADAPAKPKYPTDESMTALRIQAGCCMIPPLDGEIPRTSRLWDGVGAALLADPIMKAAVAWVHNPTIESARGLANAVNEAGL